MEIKNIFKSLFPLIIGIFIGAGITKNKAVWGILITVILVVIIRKLIINTIRNKSKTKSKKQLITGALLDWYIEQVRAGFDFADRIYANLYSSWIFILNITLFIWGIINLINKNYTWAFIQLMALQVIITQNHIIRRLK